MTFRNMVAENGLRWVAVLAGFTILAACSGSSGSSKTGSSAPASSARMASTNNDTKKKFQDCTKLLMDSLQKPTAPYHFSYKAQENINPKFPMDKTAKPEVGPVELEGDFSPDEISLTSVRGKEKTEHKAAKTDQLAWSMTALDTSGPILSTGMMLAFGQLVAQSSGSDSVGGVPADKYDFDTSSATGSTKAGLDIAKAMLTNIQSTKGTVWIEKSTGKLVKFNIDADYADKNSNSWKEHYEGVVTPK